VNACARTALAAALLAGALAVPAGAQAASGDGVQHRHYRFGPITITPGTNVNTVGPITEKPNVDGYITKFTPNLRRLDGSIPRVDVLHLHHGVWLNLSQPSINTPFAGVRIQPFAAAGEEKTTLQLPMPYGYFNRATDRWLMNYMIHNLTPTPDKVYLNYDVDFVPADSALGRRMRAVRPVWMDVQAGNAYPVFDVRKGAGRNQRFTYPDQARNPYGGGPRLNEWTVDRPGTLVATAGHVHPGGLHTDLELVRRGAAPARAGPVRGSAAHSVRLFRSVARYWDRRGPISWDMSMTATPSNWRVGVRPGDTLRVSATYDSRRAAWYEAMGIMIVYMADDQTGANPFAKALPLNGRVTHGHLAENRNHGGTGPPLVDARTLPSASPPPNDTVNIGDFRYRAGDLSLPGAARNPPTIRRGQSLRFVNGDSSKTIWHSITACRAPCNLSTGISYPLADGTAGFDSGQLGFGPRGFTAAANRKAWNTPTTLTRGTYTYFCRVHPFMRGAFRVR
jgi:plastocyanin